MKCPHCNQGIAENVVLRESASIMGSRSKRMLTPDQAREMARLSHLKRKMNQKGGTAKKGL